MNTAILNHNTGSTNWPKADEAASHIVEALLSELGPMTDDEIAFFAEAFSYRTKAGRLRHGRLLLERVGRVRCVGRSVNNSGRSARRWGLTPNTGRNA